MLYLGTENALYVSFNGGDTWQPLQNNLPHAPVYGMVIQEHFNDLVIGTYGRGFWILDDLSPLQQFTPDVAAKNAHFFKPRAAYRFRNVTAPATMPDDQTAGQNPPYGAALNYYLKSAPGPRDTVRFTVTNAQGQPVRTFTGTRNAGVNRVYWDIRNDETRAARLRTSPLYAPDVRPGPDGTRSSGIGQLSVLMPPGTYTVRLKVGDYEQSQPVEVRKDPNSGGSEEEIRTQVALLQDAQKDLNAAVDMINQIELLRAQLQTLSSFLATDEKAKDIRAAADSLERKFVAVEENLHQLKLTGRGQDGVRWPIKLAGQILYLSNGVASSDFAPTSQQLEVKQVLVDQLRAVRGQLDGLLNGDLPQFNTKLRERNIQNVMVSVR